MPLSARCCPSSRCGCRRRKVEDKKGESWIVVTDMTKDDLFNLAHYAVTEDDFEMDDYDKTSRPNPIHRIIY